MSSVFRSLSGSNYRLWSVGALVSNVGTWMQRTAQDWIVLTQLTDHDAAAVGIVMALQFGPQLLLLPLSGLVADRFDQRKVLYFTQGVMGLLGLFLGILTVTGTAELWHVYVFALLLGCVAALDAPARQTFVARLVTGPNLSNAVALNSASFNMARMIGPAVAGLLVAAVGAGWVFLINAATFGAVLVSLAMLRTAEFAPSPRAPRQRGNLAGGFRYVRSRPDIMLILVAIFIIGTFGVNFPIFISTMATVEFGVDAAGFGVLSSVLAIGSVAGALLSASRDHPRLRFMFIGAAVFSFGAALAAFSPAYWTFALALVIVGLASQIVLTTANSAIQVTTPVAVRGRVMAIFMAIFMGGTPIGAPIIGWVANEWGPRWAIGVGASSGVVACLVALIWLVKYRHLRLRYGNRRLRLSHDGQNIEAAQRLITEEVTALKG